MNSTRHDIFYILTRHTRQELKHRSVLSIDALIRILAKKYGIEIKRTQVFYHIKQLIAGGYMTRESVYTRSSTGLIQQGPSFFTRTPAGRRYLQNWGILPGGRQEI
ncbi:hypothetical protein ES708_16973 [subsurface metagenome]